jgi:predicted kinase
VPNAGERFEESTVLSELEELAVDVLRFRSLDNARGAACRWQWERRAGSERQSCSQPQCVFAAGLPASGKSLAIHELFERCARPEHIAVLDLDREITSHPKFDHTQPNAVYDIPNAYDWANHRIEQRFHQLIAERFPQVIVDGTGTKPARRIQRMQAARTAGVQVLLLVVSVSLHIALERNSMRKRRVPLEHMLFYKRALEDSVLEVAPYADCVLVLENDAAATPSVRTSSALPEHEGVGALSTGGEELVWSATTNDIY